MHLSWNGSAKISKSDVYPAVPPCYLLPSCSSLQVPTDLKEVALSRSQVAECRQRTWSSGETRSKDLIRPEIADSTEWI